MNTNTIHDQKVIRKIVKKSASSFFWGMNILSNEKKRAMFAVYAFCRLVDDIADSEFTYKKKNVLLLDWVNKIEKIYKGISNDSLTRELKYSVEKYDLLKDDFLQIIDGMKIDARKKIIYPSKIFLENYCDKVAGAVGCISINIFGVKNKSAGRNYAKYLGRALQLTNILRDVQEDVKRGRCYLFKEALQKNNINMEPNDLLKSEKKKLVLKEIFDLAENYYNLANREAIKINRNKLVAAEIMKKMYFKIFQKMRKTNWNFNVRMKLSFPEKLWVILSVLAGRQN